MRVLIFLPRCCSPLVAAGGTSTCREEATLTLRSMDELGEGATPPIQTTASELLGRFLEVGQISIQRSIVD